MSYKLFRCDEIWSNVREAAEVKSEYTFPYAVFCKILDNRMGGGTGLNLFQKHFPIRCFDVGIAEQHAVTFAAGLAAEGLKPFCAIYSSFLQRCFDQVM